VDEIFNLPIPEIQELARQPRKGEFYDPNVSLNTALHELYVEARNEVERKQTNSHIGNKQYKEVFDNEPIKEGKRNSTFTSLTGLLHTKGIPPDVALVFLNAVNKDRCKPPLEGKEIEAIIKSVYRYENNQKEDTINFSPVRLKEFMGTEAPKIDWIVDQLIVEEGVILGIGKPKIGKSILGLNIALSVAQGKPVLRKQTKQGKTLYMALEDRPKLVKSRLWKRLEKAQELNIDIHCGAISLDSKKHRDVIKDRIKREGYILVVLDPLIEVYRKADENNSNDMVQVLRWIREIAQDCGCAFFVIHHARKSDGIGGDIIRGTSAIFGAVDGAIILRDISKESGKQISIETILRDADTGEKTVAKLDSSLQWELEGSYEEFTVQNTSEKIEEFLKDGEASISQISQGIGESYDTVKKALQRLEEKDIVKSRLKGNNRKAGKIYSLSLEVSQESVPREKVNDINKLDVKNGSLGTTKKVSQENVTLSQENHSEGCDCPTCCPRDIEMDFPEVLRNE
ncbi:MAG TPA: AAA family ATPase, partial [Thermodesulfobacteriota bacterium]|nr:AAA family ATPase [Thermodesulfobacteriota bacterium]